MAAEGESHTVGTQKWSGIREVAAPRSPDVMFYCPSCGKAATATFGSPVPTVKLAIRLQMEAKGTVFQCDACDAVYLVRQLAPEFANDVKGPASSVLATAENG